MGACRIRWIWLVNALILIFLMAMIVLAEMDVMPFRRVGFHCEDPKITYKFAGDTITVWWLFSVSLLFPLAVIGLVEMTLAGDDDDGSRKMARRIRQVWEWYSQFVFGLLLLIFLVSMGKSIVSSPRPHFLDTCRPDKAVNCSTGYITDFKCTNGAVKPGLIKDSMRSFPSGHSAIGFYTAIFSIWFLQQRTSHRQSLVVPWLHCICLLWAFFCALSRITDRRHHWWDVLVGSICGIVLAVYAAAGMCRGFRVKRSKSKHESSSSENSVSSGKTCSRRLLSSTSSYSPPEEKDARTLS